MSPQWGSIVNFERVEGRVSVESRERGCDWRFFNRHNGVVLFGNFRWMISSLGDSDGGVLRTRRYVVGVS